MSSEDILGLLQLNSYFCLLPYFNGSLGNFEQRTKRFLILFLFHSAFYAFYLHYFITHLYKIYGFLIYNLCCIAYRHYVLFGLHFAKFTKLTSIAEEFYLIDCELEALHVPKSKFEVPRLRSKVLLVNLAVNIFWFIKYSLSYIVGNVMATAPISFVRSHFILNAGLLQYFYLNCLSMRMRGLGEAMEVGGRQIRRYIRIYDSICRLQGTFNDIFGWQIIFQVCFFLYHFLMLIPHVHVWFMYNWVNILQFFATGFQHLLPIFALMSMGSTVNKSVKATLSKAHLLIGRKDAKILTWQIKNRSRRITAAGFFDMDYPTAILLSNFMATSIISIIEVSNHWLDKHEWVHT